MDFEGFYWGLKTVTVDIAVLYIPIKKVKRKKIKIKIKGRYFTVVFLFKIFREGALQ